MEVAILFSGGKDSTRTLHWCLEKKYDVKYLVTMIPKRKDSWMYHVPNIHLTNLLSEAVEISLIQKETSGIKEKEIEDMKKVLNILDIDAVACGGIASKYQKSRIEKVCKELNLKLLTPFWGTDPEKFIKDTIDLGFDVRIVGVYAEGFDKSWLGRKLDYKTFDDLKELNKKHGISIVGEGGGFESLVVDAPMFKRRVEIIKSKIVWDRKTESGYLDIKEARLVPKRM